MGGVGEKTYKSIEAIMVKENAVEVELYYFTGLTKHKAAPSGAHILIKGEDTV